MEESAKSGEGGGGGGGGGVEMVFNLPLHTSYESEAESQGEAFRALFRD